MAHSIYPYRREIRPSLDISLGEHTDREYEKIERALKDITVAVDECCASGTGGGSGSGGIEGGFPDRILGGTSSLDGGAPADR